MFIQIGDRNVNTDHIVAIRGLGERGCEVRLSTDTVLSVDESREELAGRINAGLGVSEMLPLSSFIGSTPAEKFATAMAYISAQQHPPTVVIDLVASR